MRSLKGSIRKFAVGITPINDMHMADYDFSCVFYVNNNSRAIELSKADMKQINQDSYMAIVDTSKLAAGKIHCRIEAYIPDADVKDGLRLEIYDVEESQATASASCLNITLWDLVKYPRVSMESICDAKPTDLETLNGDETVLVTLPNKTKGQISIENLAKSIGGDGGVSSSEYFKTYPTMADYEADKANIEIPCVVMIQDTEEIVWHSTKGNYNAYYEVNQHYFDAFKRIMGASPEIAFPVIGVEGIPLTIASFMFSSFIVNGEEKITGDEYIDLEADDIEVFRHCMILVPFELDKTYEVSYTLKSQEELAEYGELGGIYTNIFAYSPLTKIIINESWRNDLFESFNGIPFILFIWAKSQALTLREVTMNLEEYPFTEEGATFGAELAVGLFRQDVMNIGGLSMLCPEGDRVIKIPNGEGWGYAYEEGMTEEDVMQGGFIMGLTAPNEIDEILPPFNVERFDYGTI